ncbi:hypothetical protein SAMN06295879_0474 [Agreia bicolorata]|uniref:Uncharacterized protein n=1 Tax=Agreia bicolorata TaxID=110935 RepID=A0A1T4WYH8_9MICO|nr:hypothetical protein SAMN06295879_0474 [Agreia bicolorata]
MCRKTGCIARENPVFGAFLLNWSGTAPNGAQHPLFWYAHEGGGQVCIISRRSPFVNVNNDEV